MNALSRLGVLPPSERIFEYIRYQLETENPAATMVVLPTEKSARDLSAAYAPLRKKTVVFDGCSPGKTQFSEDGCPLLPPVVGDDDDYRGSGR